MNIVKVCSLLIILFTGSSCSLVGVGSEEQPSYDVLLKNDQNEIRKYKPYLVAKVTIDGSFKEAQSKGFKILAGYIFGKNKSQEKIAMTSPVIQKPEELSEKISMTAPVLIAPEKEENRWSMTFSMPSKYSLETLPKPEDERIIIEKVESRLIAAHVFSGFWNQEKIEKKGDELLKWLEQKKKYTPTSSPMFAGYNPPWTLPFFRRNEVLIEIKL